MAFLAHAALAAHAAWVLAVLLLPLVAWRRRRWRAVHLSMMGATVLFALVFGGCPLTFLENRLWSAAGEAAYRESFLAHWLERLVYWEVPQAWLTAASAGWFALWAAVYRRLGGT